MAGVPQLKDYISPLVVRSSEIYLQRREETERKYTSWFESNTKGCEFKEGDTLKGGTGSYTRTETFVANSDGKDQNKSVVAETSNIVTPTGASTQNITVKGHTSSTEIYAIWTGTISNNTSEPEDIGKFDPGKPEVLVLARGLILNSEN